MKRRTNRRAQTQKPRCLPTSGFGLHEGTLKDVEDKRDDWKRNLDLDEVLNWKEYV